MPVTNEQLLSRVREVRSKILHLDWDANDHLRLLAAVFEIDIQKYGDREISRMFVKAFEEVGKVPFSPYDKFSLEKFDTIFDLMERYCRVWVVS